MGQPQQGSMIRGTGQQSRRLRGARLSGASVGFLAGTPALPAQQFVAIAGVDDAPEFVALAAGAGSSSR